MVRIKYVIVGLIILLNAINLGMFYEINSYNNVIVLDDCLDNTYDALEVIKEHLDFLERLPTGPPCKGYISSGFGYRNIPYSQGRQFHTGIDIVGSNGDNIYSTGKGIVVFVGRQGASGNLIIIDHENNYHTYYAHLSETEVVLNEKIDKNDLIGKMGSTGRTTGTHLHYEVRYKERPVNPMVYYIQ